MRKKRKVKKCFSYDTIFIKLTVTKKGCVCGAGGGVCGQAVNLQIITKKGREELRALLLAQAVFLCDLGDGQEKTL